MYEISDVVIKFIQSEMDSRKKSLAEVKSNKLSQKVSSRVMHYHHYDLW